MSAKDQMRAMLDELMGTTRNGETSKNAIKFDDHRVCKAFLLGCCPHEILSQTVGTPSCALCWSSGSVELTNWHSFPWDLQESRY